MNETVSHANHHGTSEQRYSTQTKQKKTENKVKYRFKKKLTWASCQGNISIFLFRLSWCIKITKNKTDIKKIVIKEH